MNLGILIQLIIIELTGRGYLGTAPSSSLTQEEKGECASETSRETGRDTARPIHRARERLVG